MYLYFFVSASNTDIKYFELPCLLMWAIQKTCHACHRTQFWMLNLNTHSFKYLHASAKTCIFDNQILVFTDLLYPCVCVTKRLLEQKAVKGFHCKLTINLWESCTQTNEYRNLVHVNLYKHTYSNQMWLIYLNHFHTWVVCV